MNLKMRSGIAYFRLFQLLIILMLSGRIGIYAFLLSIFKQEKEKFIKYSKGKGACIKNLYYGVIGVGKFGFVIANELLMQEKYVVVADKLLRKFKRFARFSKLLLYT